MRVRKWFRQSVAARSLLRQSLGRAKTPAEHQARQLAASVLDSILDNVETYYTVDKMDTEAYIRRFLPLADEIAHLDNKHRRDVQLRVMRALGQLFLFLFQSILSILLFLRLLLGITLLFLLLLLFLQLFLFGGQLIGFLLKGLLLLLKRVGLLNHGLHLLLQHGIFQQR